MPDESDDMLKAALARLPDSALAHWLVKLFEALAGLRAQVVLAAADLSRFERFLQDDDQSRFIADANAASAALRRLSLLMFNLTPVQAHRAPADDGPLFPENLPTGIAAWRRLVEALRFLHLASATLSDHRGATAGEISATGLDAVLIRQIRAALPRIESLRTSLGGLQPHQQPISRPGADNDETA